MNRIHEQCPLCHFSYPTSHLPAHLAAHRHARERGAALGAELAKLSDADLAQALLTEVWAELNPLREWRAVAVVEAAIERLEQSE
jgi:hypothetical protein